MNGWFDLALDSSLLECYWQEVREGPSELMAQFAATEIRRMRWTADQAWMFFCTNAPMPRLDS